MGLPARTYLTPEEYLAQERAADYRSEYFEGEVFAMAGTSRRHSRIVSNLVIGLGNQLRERGCNIYSNDLRVQVAPTGLYTYPDVVITCGKELLADKQEDTLLNPVVLIEVPSESTEAYDRGRKFAQYQQIAALREYVLVTQGPPWVEVFSRHEQDGWLYRAYHVPDDTVVLESIGCQLRLDEVYFRTEPQD
jgi:Uma2 family endonuclease